MERGGHVLPKVYLGPSCCTLLRPVGGPPLKGLTAVSGVARPQGGRPAALFYPFVHPMPYACENCIIYDYGLKNSILMIKIVKVFSCPR
jgi:hypothetical protein